MTAELASESRTACGILPGSPLLEGRYVGHSGLHRHGQRAGLAEGWRACPPWARGYDSFV